MTRPAQAWSGFWRDQSPAGTRGTLSDLPPALRDRLDAPWLVLAEALPPKARVLDLATGGGIVLDMLRSRRDDLKLTGVDSASALPKRAGMTLLSGVDNAALPFADRAFDAVTSRFGIEYGPLAPSAAEAARVLRAGGRLRVLSHHSQSPVLAHNRARAGALAWAVRESGWFDKAVKFANARKTLGLGAAPGAFAAAPALAAARYPDQPVAWEFLTGIAQILHLVSADEAVGTLKQLGARAEDELARLDALAAAALDETRLGVLVAALTAAGMQIDPPEPLRGPDGLPLAWLIIGVRAP